MTSIYDIPYEDIKEFLLFNNRNFKNEDDAYNMARDLLKDKKAIGHTTSIIEWMMAYNLLILKVNIPIYTISEIDKMSQVKINQLAKLLKMNGNNRDNIKNILKYLHKLDDETLLPVINEFILQNLNKLEINEINFETLHFSNVIKLLKTHRNKVLIRKQIYDNMEEIVLYNVINFDYKKLDDLEYIEYKLIQVPKYIILELIKYNKKRLLKNHTIEDINILIDFLNEDRREGELVDLYLGMKILTNFLIDLIKIKEIGLAKKVFDIANNYKFTATIANKHYSFNQYLIEKLLYFFDNIVVLKTLLDFIGEDYFIKNLDTIINHVDADYIKVLVNYLLILEKYDLLVEIFEVFRFKNYKVGSNINIILLIIKAHKSHNNNLLKKYLNILSLALDNKLKLSIDDLIKDIEQDES